ncbi:acyl-CoA synthetase MbcS [Ureibacillus thermosphaericus]|uniref:Acetyl-CoA synthetase n=1 Tax=Ureibacillus thermosphaericus TaxID=51173 RepID=A0A840PV79_URETH|nr:acyl--CoA ligase [Ureibacillus thermosphaericus]MBB5148078.1 acetyl-CoA synthetase [Ureibacillus thermosphaericus]NKZ30789.1 AMP-binding protein [Ureibacillus thermosphaericus]
MKREDLLAPEKYNIADEFEKWAKDENKVALLVHHEDGTTEKITFVELLKRANKVANLFKKHGLTKGDVLLVMVPRSAEAYATYIGALKAGITIIPSSEMLRAKDIDYRIEHSGAKGIVAFSNEISQFDDVKSLNGLKLFVYGEANEPWIQIEKELENLSDEFNEVQTKSSDVAFLSYTSGTTGNPKGVIHTHSWGYAHLRTAAEHWLGVKENDLAWATAAPGWQKWIWSPFLAILGSGATAFVHTGRFDPKNYLQMLQDYKINVLCCTPTEYRLMAKVDDLESYDLSNLRSAVSAGEPLNSEVINKFLNVFNLQVRDGYGQTENTLLVGTLLGMKPKPGSMGKPTPGNIVDIINEDGEPTKPGEVGDIAVHSSTPALFKGYLNDPERTQRQFRGEWYLTGDRAYKDEEGYFWFEGRGDDIIISSGYTIGPFEVEDALVKHPAVKECAVVASPDEIRGSIVKAFVVLKDPSLKDSPTLVQELQEHVKNITAPYKYPRAIEFIDELPKTASGKIRRVELRQREMQKQVLK